MNELFSPPGRQGSRNELWQVVPGRRGPDTVTMLTWTALLSKHDKVRQSLGLYVREGYDAVHASARR